MTQRLIKNIFLSDGRHLGFIEGNFLYSRDGVYMGWLEGEIAWDKDGNFRGVLTSLQGNLYILNDKFAISPSPRTPKVNGNVVAPNPPANIRAIMLPTGLVDGFLKA